MGKFIIHTSHVFPPIPVRDYDWNATLDGYEPGGPIGTGATEFEAVRDLIDWLEENADA